MKQLPSQARRQRSFTLVELLVVIAIIGVLVGLLLAAVFGIMKKVSVTRTRHEMSELDVALQSFKTKYGFYPPSRIRLRERLAEYYPFNNAQQPDQLDIDSVYYLTKMFPRIQDTWAGNLPNGPNPAMGLLPGMDWNLNGQIDQNVNIVLEGDQCLVFFLGGMGLIDPTTNQPSVNGWSTDVSNPIKIAVANQGGQLIAQVIGDRNKFYEFDSKRLVYLYQTPNASNPTPPPPNGLPYQNPPAGTPVGQGQLLHPNYLPTSPPPNQGFPFMSYADHFGTCDGQGALMLNSPLLPIPGTNPPVMQPPGGVYAYFSSYKKENGYNRYWGYQGLTLSDCQTLGVWPYAQGNQPNLYFPNLRYMNSNTYQIISSGRDTIFGSGTSPWAAEAQYWFGGPTTRAYADITSPPYPTVSPPPPQFFTQPTPPWASVFPNGANYVAAGADDLGDFAEGLLGNQ
jgi:prepilin-type N-terminal cleavage/methylation domain-containing protein